MKQRILKSLIAFCLVLALLLNLAACSGVFAKRGGTSEQPSIGIDFSGNGANAPEYADPDYPTVPSGTLSFSKTVLALSEAPREAVELSVDSLRGLDVAFRTDPNEGLKSYSVPGGLEVVFDTSADPYNVIDAITVDDQIVLEQVYYHTEGKELALDEVYADYYSVEIDYTEHGKVRGIYYSDHAYLYEYDAQDRLTRITRDGKNWLTLSYNALGKIVKETRSTEKGEAVRAYAYTANGELCSVNKDSVARPNQASDGSLSIGGVVYRWHKDAISDVTGDVTARFEYGYTFNGQNFLTRKTVDGVTTEYAYLGDKIVSSSRGRDQLFYILDNKLNYVGVKYKGSKYYFEVDPFGNVLALIDCDGNAVVEYELDVWGNLIRTSGPLSDTLGALNEIVNLNALYDADLKAYFFGTELYLPASGLLLKSDEMGQDAYSHTRSVYELEQNIYFARSAVSDFARIHDQVVRVAIENLKEHGLDVIGNLYAVDERGNAKRLVDIYTVDYSIVPFSAMNLINGNQIYEVMYHAPDSMAFEKMAKEKLKTISRELAVSYFGGYHATPGTMQFHGQFIYLGYLIDYRCQGDGIVEYQVKIDKKSNYDLSVNIYDYDRNQYVCYVNNTFDLNFLDGVTIIPGISRETFDALDGYLGDYLQAIAGDICDQLLIYDDPAYYNMDQMNVMPDYWAQMNLPDSTQFLEIQIDGSVSVETIPAWQQDQFRTHLLIGVGVVIVTAVVATVAIAIPGANCVVVSICVGMAKGAATGAISGFAMGLVEPLIDIGIEGVATGNWDFQNYFNDALTAAAKGFSSGAVTGAILGGIQGALKPTACFEAGTPVATIGGTVAIENITIGDSVWSYDYTSGKTEPKPVTAMSVQETTELVTLEVGGERIVTTPEHPFYVVNHDQYNGYVAAKYLSIGDCIQTYDGKYLTIAAIEQETFDEPITVYNLTVEGYHSYYVGGNELLVHNAGCTPPKVDTSKKPDVSHPKLQEYVNALYDHRRENPLDMVGDGTTMAAINNEIRTGIRTCGSYHMEKGSGIMCGLRRLINTNTLSDDDLKVAFDLYDALTLAFLGKY